jgi:hypothetical protein
VPQRNLMTACGRSIVDGMPGGAAHTAATRLTARFAVYPGEVSAISCPHRALMLGGWWNWPHLVTTFAPDSSSRHTSSMSNIRGM